MKWFSFIFRHGLLVAVVVGIAIAYSYRYQLFPRFFEQDATPKVASVEAGKTDTIDSEKPPALALENKQNTQTSPEDMPPLASSKTLPKSISATTDGQVVNTTGETENAQPGKTSEKANNSSVDVIESKASDLPANSQNNTVNTTQVPVHPAQLNRGQASSLTDPKEGLHTADKSLEQPATGAVDDKAVVDTTEAAKNQSGKGLIADPMNTMSGMMRKPTQSLSGMMGNPVQSTQQMITGSEKSEVKGTPSPTASGSPGQQAGSMPQTMTNHQAAPPRPAQPTTGGMQQQQQYRQLISQARQAYWQGQYKQSEAYYKQAIAAESGNPDTYGELGNLYYAQGLWDESGESLYQSAIRLLDMNRPDKAYNLLSVIRGLKHKRGDELEERLKKFQGKQSK